MATAPVALGCTGQPKRPPYDLRFIFFLTAARMRVLNADPELEFVSGRFDCHSASAAAAICFIVRPLLTDSSSRFFERGFIPPAVFMSSH
jgi:hypothetical protein